MLEARRGMVQMGTMPDLGSRMRAPPGILWEVGRDATRPCDSPAREKRVNPAVGRQHLRSKRSLTGLMSGNNMPFPKAEVPCYGNCRSAARSHSFE
jgi:hypothetical protein